MTALFLTESRPIERFRPWPPACALHDRIGFRGGADVRYRAIAAALASWAAGWTVFAVALRVLHGQLHATSWPDLSADIHHTSARQLLLAVVLTALNYALLTGYDFLGCASLGLRLPAREIARTSFLAYGIANTVGGLALAGYSVRYRFYTRSGLSLGDLSRLALSDQ